jgi:hypothetical protein
MVRRLIHNSNYFRFVCLFSFRFYFRHVLCVGGLPPWHHFRICSQGELRSIKFTNLYGSAPIIILKIIFVFLYKVFAFVLFLQFSRYWQALLGHFWYLQTGVAWSYCVFGYTNSTHVCVLRTGRTYLWAVLVFLWVLSVVFSWVLIICTVGLLIH